METESADAQDDRRTMTLTWTDIYAACQVLVARHQGGYCTGVFGVPTGGSVVAAIVAAMLDQPQLDEPRMNCLVVDDLVDSGKTLRRYAGSQINIDALYRKPNSPKDLATHASVTPGGWIKFPWEHDGEPTDLSTSARTRRETD